MSRILIIEDEEAIAELEKDYLELSGFEVIICNRGDLGLNMALKEDFDLIILDLMLPEIDGFEICRQVREAKNTPIIMVSAKKDDIDKIRGLGLGADDYMTKPFSPSELVARVKADDMQTMIETVSMIANFGEDVAPVTMKFNENSIHISVESTEASTEVDVPAEITDGAGREFYYNAKHFTDMAKVIKTEADIHLTNGGILYVSNGLSEYMLVNTRKREVKRKVKKTVSKAKKAA